MLHKLNFLFALETPRGSLILVAAFFCIFQCSAQSSISDLDKLIGEWKVSEVFMQGTPHETREEGVRQCFYILDSAYIQCHTKSVTRSGKKREYIFMINFNKINGQFEMVSIYSDWPLKRNDVITLQSKDLWDVVGTATIENGVSRRVWGVIEFSTPYSYVWKGSRNTSSQRPNEWTPLFEETGQKIND
jgi:hypothetical protein